MSGSGKLRLSSGTLKLADDNTAFSGAATVTGGMLGLYRNSALGTGTLSIGGASLKLGRAVTSIANDITLTGATALSFDTDVDYLIIGGGGAGGSSAGGGGGAGGFVEGSTNLTAASTAITVGAGGVASSANGANSSLGTLVALGGGGGASMGGTAAPGNAGASGGGGNRATTTGTENTLGAAGGAATQPGSASGGYGFAGGDGRGIDGTNTKGGGGGGAGGVGQDGPVGLASAGTGGAGRYSSITGSALAYAGGGGGGGGSSIVAGGAGGLGGGGAGAVSATGVVAGSAGLANTGGGGGGGSSKAGGGSNGGAGGSGVVVVRYLGDSGGTGGTVTSGTGAADGYTLHSFTGTGSSTLSLSPLAATFGGTISGSGALSVNSGTGSVTLTGANTYTGATTIDGTLKLGAGGSNVALATSGIVNNGSLFVNTADAVTLAANISGAGPLTKQGAGALTLTGANSYSGSTTISGGNLIVGNGGTAGSLGTGSVFNDGTLTFNRSDNVTVANTLSGLGMLVQAGSGNLTLSGANSTGGITQLNAGILTLGSAPALGLSGSIRFGGGTLKHGTGFTSDLSARFSAAAGQMYRIDTNGQAITYASALTSSTGTLTKLGSGSLTLKGQNSYTGATAISAGSLVLENDAPGILSGTISGPGALTIRSAGASFTGTLDLSGWSFGSDLGALTIGKSGNTAAVTLNAATLASPVSIFGGAVTFAGAFSTSGTLSVAASGAVTQSGGISAASLLLSGSGQVTLTHAGNAVGTLSGGASGARLGAVSFTNGGALNLGGAGLYSSGDVRVATISGDLSLAQTVDTTSTSATALRLAAGTGAAAGGDGMTTAGNVLIVGSPLLKAGTGGIIAVYSGDVAGSTGLSALAGGAGSGRFRYNSTIGSAGYTTALQANVANAIYRQQPRIESAVADQTMTYGSLLGAVALMNGSGLLNGDTFVGSAVIGALSNAGHVPVGTYELKATGELAGLGYDMSGVSAGTLTVNRKTLTVSGVTALDKVYDGTRTATLDTASLVYDGLVTDDIVTVNVSGLFGDKNVGTGKMVALTSSYGGADLGNYTITDQTSASASITAKALTVSGIAALDKVYDGTRTAMLDTASVVYDGLVTDDIVTVNASGLFGDKNVGAGKMVALTSSYGGADLGNYAITDQTQAYATIVRLASVRAILPAAGTVLDWFDRASWEGGAVPDRDNVAEAILPAGVTVRFAPAFATGDVDAVSPVSLDALTQGGSLIMNGGALEIGSGGILLDTVDMSGGVLRNAASSTLKSYRQDAGAFAGAGAFSTDSLNQAGGTLTLGNDLTVRTRFAQAAQGEIAVQRNLSISHSGDDLMLGALAVGGSATLTSLDGAIRQSSATALRINGALVAGTGNGSSAYDILLGWADNQLQGPVTIDGANDATIATRGALSLTAKRIGAALSAQAAGKLDAVLDMAGSARLATDEGGDVFASGTVGALEIASAGTTRFGPTKINGNLTVLSAKSVTETHLSAVTFSGKAAVTATTGLVELGALSTAPKLTNETVAAVANVVSTVSALNSAKGNGGGFAAASPQDVESMLDEEPVTITDLPPPDVGATPTRAPDRIIYSLAPSSQSGSPIRVSFAEPGSSGVDGAENTVPGRKLQVFRLHAADGQTATSLTVSEDGNGYLVMPQASDGTPDNAALHTLPPTATDPGALADAVDLAVDDGSGQTVMFSVSVVDGTLTVAARDAQAEQLLANNPVAVIAFGLAEVRKQRSVGLDAVSRVVLANRTELQKTQV